MIVYALVNQVNGKCYIGQTRGNQLTKRWSRNLTNGPNQHLKAAIDQYGPDQFIRQILAQCDTEAEADNLEKLWISVLQTWDGRYGYNMQFGGRTGPGKHSADIRRRIGESTRKMWDRMSPKDRWEFQLATKLRWLSRTELERLRISRKVSKALTGKPRTVPVWNKGLSPAPNRGKPSGKKGRKYGPQKHPCKQWGPKTEEHRKHISEALKMYHKRKKTEKRKPPQSVKKPIKPESPKPIQNDRLRRRFEELGGCSW